MKFSSCRKLFAVGALSYALVGLPCPVAYAAETVIADGAPDAPFEGVLLLANGGLIRGNISRVGDRWVAKSAEREIEVPAKSVEMACRSLEEAYDLRRKRIVRPSAEAHLTLADWCLRYELFPQAALELLDARGLDPQNPQLRRLDARLAVATRPRPVATAATPPVKPSKAPPADVATAQPATVAPKTLKPQPEPADLKAALADTQPIVATTSELSDTAIERFTRKIQPMLVNNCTTAGCHRPGGPQTFQLDRALLRGLSNRHTTMANLSATLAQVDRQQPAASPLLGKSRTAHGGMDRHVIGPHQEQMASQLAEWVAMVTEKPTANENEITIAAGKSTNPPVPMIGPQPRSIAPAAFEAAIETPALPAAGPRYGAQIRPSWQPKDPFDPEIFNRQLARER